MWKHVGESVAGTSHRRTDTPCQDSHQCQQFRIEEELILVAVCSDGAGSAELSEIGSRIACAQFSHLAYEGLTALGGLRYLTAEDLRAWYESVQRAVADEAALRNVPVRQLACTLLTAVVGEERALFAQIGDGSIVYRAGATYAAPFWPQTGEYANTTNFITEPKLFEAFELYEHPHRVDELALFTDGLQRLTLDFSRRLVHQRFFEPMFATLRTAEHADELVVPLRTFLDSPAVNDRTDDDKTLILAARCNSDEPPSRL